MNRNIFYAQIFVDELARAGLKAVCAAPGSRHTPLMLAFAKHEDIKVYSHLDERSAAFFALGLAMASNEPVALVCTSGTAGANMYPAIIEAHQSRVPLLVLTADRPPELRHSGANQTIDQVKMFGDFVLWFVDAALPEANPPAVAIRNLRTLAARALAKANGIRKGVVHINMPFRKPLEPTPVEADVIDVPGGTVGRDGAFVKMHRAYMIQASSDEGRWLRYIVDQHKNGIIICGGNLLPQDAYGIHAAAEKIGYPVLAETYSHTRHGHDSYGAYDFYLKHVESPDIIIRAGDVPISKVLNTFITNANPEYYLHISPDGYWSDDDHSVTHQIQTMFAPFFGAIYSMPMPDLALKTRYATLEKTTWQTIDHEIETGDYFDGAAVYDVVDLIPDESTLFVGNSLPVRHLDQFGKPQNKRIYTYANRGASGIDGNISTALGAGAARPEKPLVAILGDITFYHDMNGLLAVHRCGVPVTIVLLNNDGGGIFNRLPIKNFEPEFTDYFITPHGLDFEHAAKLYGLAYVQFDMVAAGIRQAFRAAFTESVTGRKSMIIELKSNSQRDEQRRRAIVQAVHEAIRELDV